MPGAHPQSKQFDLAMLELLVCPVCFGSLRLETSGLQIACLACERIYPCVDGIPVLIPERAAALKPPPIRE
jgi:uncharacterized protein YbaR (Trm112 family)